MDLKKTPPQTLTTQLDDLCHFHLGSFGDYKPDNRKYSKWQIQLVSHPVRVKLMGTLGQVAKEGLWLL